MPASSARLLLTLILSAQCVCAVADTAAAFSEGKAFSGSVDAGAAAKSGAFTSGGRTFGVGDVTDMSVNRGGSGDLANPPEASISGDNLDPTAAYNAENTAGDAGRWVSDAFSKRPLFTIDPKTDPLIMSGRDIQANPAAFAGTLDASYGSCKTIAVTGSAGHESRVCQESREMVSGVCEKTLNVTVKAETVSSCKNGDVLAVDNLGCFKRSGTDWHDRISYAVCNTAKPGYQQIGSIGGFDIGAFGSSGCGKYKPPNPNDPAFPKFWLSDDKTTAPVYFGSYQDSDMYYVGGCEEDNCSYTIIYGHNNGGFTYPQSCPAGSTPGETFQPGDGNCYVESGSSQDYCDGTYFNVVDPNDDYRREFPRCFNVVATRAPNGYAGVGHQMLAFKRARVATNHTIESESWTDNCAGRDANSACTMGKTTCTDGPGTKNINGMDVTRECWKYQRDYSCIGSTGMNNCQTLRDAGCSQISSKCIASNDNGACGSYEQTYQCQVTPTSSTTVTSCGNAMTCLDGNCFNTTAPPNGDFALAATHMNVMKEMGQDYDPATLQIFKGVPLGCTKTFLDISDCCGDKGWGLDLNLASCSEEEKQLAQNARGGRCHQVGSFCSDKTVLGICVQTKVRWCCFSSKLSRIINEQGRPQLGKGWGTAEEPDCSGFTVEEIQKLDFAKMDLSEFYADVMATAKMLDVGQMTVTNRITNYYDTGTHSIPEGEAAPYNPSVAPSVK